MCRNGKLTGNHNCNKIYCKYKANFDADTKIDPKISLKNENDPQLGD